MTQVIHVRGNVFVAADRNTPATPIRGSVLLDPDEYVRTDDRSLAELRLPDGSVVEIGQNTEIQAGEFHRTEFRGAAGQNVISIFRGTIRFHIVRTDNTPANYKFQTPQLQIAIRGTTATVSVTDTLTEVTMLEGSAGISAGNGSTFILRAGQTFRVRSDGGQILSKEIIPTAVDPSPTPAGRP